MPWKGNDYQPTLNEATSQMTYDKYSDELLSLQDELTDVVNGARKEYADRLRDYALIAPPRDRIAILKAAALLDPYNTNTGGGRFTRSAFGSNGAIG